MMEGPAEVPYPSADARLPAAAAVFDAATALDTARDMFDPEPAVVQRLVGPVLLRRQLLARISTWGSVHAKKPRSCKSRLPAGKGYGVAAAMGLSWVRPPYVSRRKRMRSRALTSSTFFPVWSFFLPL